MSVTTYTTVNGQILCQSKDGVVSHFVSDPLGSVVMVRDNSGNTVYEAEYDPYGNVQSETGTNPSEFGYVGTLGYVKDSATSLYVRARYLLTNLGRWLTKDPLWPSEPGFVYAGASPSMWVDQTGNQSKPPKPKEKPKVNGIEIDVIPVPPMPHHQNRVFTPEGGLACLQRIYSQVGAVHNGATGVQNALRHCVGACEASRQCWPFHSLICLHDVPSLGEAILALFRGDHGLYIDRMMDVIADTHNNSQGFSCSTGLASCESCCQKRLAAGDLIVTIDPRPFIRHRR